LQILIFSATDFSFAAPLPRMTGSVPPRSSSPLPVDQTSAETAAGSKS